MLVLATSNISFLMLLLACHLSWTYVWGAGGGGGAVCGGVDEGAFSSKCVGVA